MMTDSLLLLLLFCFEVRVLNRMLEQGAAIIVIVERTTEEYTFSGAGLLYTARSEFQGKKQGTWEQEKIPKANGRVRDADLTPSDRSICDGSDNSLRNRTD